MRGGLWGLLVLLALGAVHGQQGAVSAIGAQYHIIGYWCLQSYSGASVPLLVSLCLQNKLWAPVPVPPERITYSISSITNQPYQCSAGQGVVLLEFEEAQSPFRKYACATCPPGYSSTAIPFESGLDIPACIKCEDSTYSNAWGSSSCSNCTSRVFGTAVENVFTYPYQNISLASETLGIFFPVSYGGQQLTAPLPQPPIQVSCTGACSTSSYFDYSSQSCKNCTNGHVPQDVPLAQCLPCPKSTYHSASNSTCYPCGLSQIAPNVGSSHCTDCAAGQYGNRQNHSCVFCTTSGGKFIQNGASCVDCSFPLGYSPVGTLEASCQTCAPGYVQTANRTSCVPCAAGTRWDASLGCVQCDVNQYSPEGSVACIDCENGFFAASKGSTECVRCVQANQFCASFCNESRYWLKDGECVPCAVNWATNLPLHPKCVPCAAGTHRPALSSSCKACEAGYYSGTSGSPCVACPWSQFTADVGSTRCQGCGGEFLAQRPMLSAKLPAHWSGREQNTDIDVSPLCRSVSNNHYVPNKPSAATACVPRIMYIDGVQVRPPAYLTGEQGAQGPVGAPGIQGPVGERGESGARGSTGPHGANGAPGAQGERGATGRTGSVVLPGSRITEAWMITILSLACVFFIMSVLLLSVGIL